MPHLRLIPTRPAPALATVALGLLAASMTAAAAPPADAAQGVSAQADRAVTLPSPKPDVSVLTARCLMPYLDRGTYTIPARYSGAGTSTKPVRAGKVLQVRSVTITLAERDWRGAHLGVWTAGNFAWYPLRMHGGNAVFRVDADGPLYADGGGQTFKFVSYRAQGHDRPASGTYEVRGCLLDRIPVWVTRPDLRVPRYPKKVLTPLEPVEFWDGARRKMPQPR